VMAPEPAHRRLVASAGRAGAPFVQDRLGAMPEL
jgi:hypothetical protein